MAKTRTSQDASARLAARLRVVANGAVQAFNALAADRALAQRAAATAALPRQRLAELRALYTNTTHDPIAAGARVDQAAGSAAAEFHSACEETRSMT